MAVLKFGRMKAFLYVTLKVDVIRFVRMWPITFDAVDKVATTNSHVYRQYDRIGNTIRKTKKMCSALQLLYKFLSSDKKIIPQKLFPQIPWTCSGWITKEYAIKIVFCVSATARHFPLAVNKSVCMMSLDDQKKYFFQSLWSFLKNIHETVNISA